MKCVEANGEKYFGVAVLVGFGFYSRILQYMPDDYHMSAIVI